MAAKQRFVAMPALLGFVDEEISTKYGSGVNYRTSKIGGLPDWPTAGCEIPVCHSCRVPQVLVLQVYAPVHNCTDHRTLYVFTCLTPSCWGAPHSWTCIRVQVPTTPRHCVQNKSPREQKSCTEPLFYVEEDWGSDSDDDSNGEKIQQMTLQRMDADTVTENTKDNLSATVNANEASFNKAHMDYRVNNDISENGNVKKSNDNSIFYAKDKYIDPITIAMPLLNLNKELPSALAMSEDAGLCAEGSGEEEEASAVIEGPEDDMVVVESPELPTRDVTRWFKTPSKKCIAVTSLHPYFLTSEEEEVSSTTATLHERELVHYYSTLHQTETCDNTVAAPGGAGSDGTYVKAVPLHGDRLLQKFKKRIASAPEQVIRYCRESISGPLLLRPLAGVDVQSRCCQCRGPLVFELQVMPQLIPHLVPHRNTKDGGATSTAPRHSSRHSPVPGSTEVMGQPGCARPPSLSRGEGTARSDPQQSRESVLLLARNADKPDKLISLDNECLSSGIVEYGTVLVYTCAASCWRGAPWREVVVVQPEVI